MPTRLERIGVVPGVYVDPGVDPNYLDFTDAGVLALVETGDTLVLIAAGATLGTPTGGDWTVRLTAGAWKVWTKAATASAALPTLEAADAGNDAVGALLVYRQATSAYVVGNGAANSSAATATHTTTTVAVIDSVGLLVGAWRGTGAGLEPRPPPPALTELVRAQSSNASGGGERWLVIATSPIDGVPTAGPLELETSAPAAMDMLIVALRDRPPRRPAALVDSGAGANLGLLP